MDNSKTLRANAGNKGDKVRSDCYISLNLTHGGGITIDLKSKVKSMYGRHMVELVHKELTFFDIRNAEVQITDAGALDFVLTARVEAAVKKLISTDKEYLPDFITESTYETQRDAFRLSRLYLPGNTPSLMLNAGIHRPNGIILDLEDSVAPEKKSEARMLVRNALRQVNFYGAERMIRINPLPEGLEDIKSIVGHQVHVVLVPKAERSEEILLIDQTIKEVLHRSGQAREIYLMPIIETAKGVEYAFDLATSTPSVVAMAIGLEDYTADLGVSRTPEGKESFYARTRLVNACKAAGIQPIDSVFSDVSDLDGLEKAARESRTLGYEGMGCIHPRQIPVIHRAFLPTHEEIEKAMSIMKAFKEAQEKNLGVVSLGTKMIDPPVVKKAERIIFLAQQLNNIRKS